MASPLTTTFSISLLFVYTLFVIVSANTNLTAYEALETFNFPIGILPKGALGYEFDENTGNFQAYFNGSCSFSLVGTYGVMYESTVMGTVSTNMITNLSGISVMVSIFRLNIIEVRRVDDELEFSVGIASANFPIGNFYQCPQCGCGLDCDDSNDHLVRKVRMKSVFASI